VNKFESTKVESFTETKKPFPKEKWLFVEKQGEFVYARPEKPSIFRL
jgi:hypothetical protein